jgi:hypothetical protein
MIILAPHSWPAGDREVSSLGPERTKNTKVTIYSWTDCKLCDVVREGEFARTPRPYIYGDRGQKWIAARGIE